MQNLWLGPNGAILTCMNIFATKIDQLTTYIKEWYTEHAKSDQKLVYIIDTPG